MYWHLIGYHSVVWVTCVASVAWNTSPVLLFSIVFTTFRPHFHKNEQRKSTVIAGGCFPLLWFDMTFPWLPCDLTFYCLSLSHDLAQNLMVSFSYFGIFATNTEKYMFKLTSDTVRVFANSRGRHLRLQDWFKKKPIPSVRRGVMLAWWESERIIWSIKGFGY